MLKTPEPRSFKWDTCFVVTIIVLSMLFLYLNYSPATEHWFPAFNDANREALGQLGDYVGGFLNPILAICSVLLLMWSIYFQRKEAHDNLNILIAQLQLDRDEIARSQIAETIHYELQEIEELFEEKFNPTNITYSFENADNGDKQYAQLTFDSLKSLLRSNRELYGFPDLTIHQLLDEFDPYDKNPKDPNFWRFWQKTTQAKYKMKFITTAYLEHLKVCHVQTTNDKWFSKIIEVITNYQTIGIYNSDLENEDLTKIIDARNKKAYIDKTI